MEVSAGAKNSVEVTVNYLNTGSGGQRMGGGEASSLGLWPREREEGEEKRAGGERRSKTTEVGVGWVTYLDDRPCPLSLRQLLHPCHCSFTCHFFLL